MSKLKSFIVRYNGKFIRAYEETKADKVIAEKDKEIAELEMKLARAKLVLRLNTPEALYSNLETMSRLTHEKYVIERRERHHKYKRCLAMAYVEWLKQMTLCCNPESILYRRACRREHKWKELAKKFKPNNSTAQ